MNFSLFKKIALNFLNAILLLLLVSLPVHAKRLALVMGNDNYSSVTKLQKAGNDATAMARELKAAGFAVQLHKDLNYRGMVKAVETFTNSITGGDEVVVFYAGHGVQIKAGSYLLPTDIEASSESEVEKTAYELNALTDKISEAKPAFSLVMVDACRDNPLKAKGRSVGNTRGLSAVEPPKGQMVVYSASRGQQALDRLSDKDANPNGVFTREFIARMKKPGVKIEDLMREVQDSVESLAKSVSHEQRPAIYNEARGNFYFFGSANVQVASASPSVPDLSEAQKEEKFWDDAKSAGNKDAFEAYLSLYPSGRYVTLAKANIAKFAPPPPVQPQVNPRDTLARAFVGKWTALSAPCSPTSPKEEFRLEGDFIVGERVQGSTVFFRIRIPLSSAQYIGFENGMHQLKFIYISTNMATNSDKIPVSVEYTIETDFNSRRALSTWVDNKWVVKDGFFVSANSGAKTVASTRCNL